MHMIDKAFEIKIRQDMVLRMIDCSKESPIYEEVCEEYIQAVKDVQPMIHPAALAEFGTITDEIASDTIKSGTPALYVLTTIGSEISDYVTELFSEGNCLKAMIVDAIADDYLFQMSDLFITHLKESCEGKDLKITRRLEAPTSIGMEAQKVAYEVTHAKELLGMGLTTGFMFDPVKSTSQIYLLGSQAEEVDVTHNCRLCPNKECKLRTIMPVEITVLYDGKKISFTEEKECSLMESLFAHQIFVPSVCSGRGSCGKCKVRVTKGTVAVSTQDKKLFTEEQLAQGMRLSCCAFPTEDLTIAIESETESEMAIVGLANQKQEVSFDQAYLIGIDIGTTTIALSLVESATGTVVDSYLTINRQRMFGADVISRIQASNDGKKEELRESICHDLITGIRQLTKDFALQLERIVIAGNTTMLHLLMGYPCDSLGVYPFTPYRIETLSSTLFDVFQTEHWDEKDKNLPVILLPGISTFVGADIVSDLLVCKMAESQKVSFLIDLGTNGEMAIGNRDRILVTSTAAGPAFEGGNITQGIGSVPGAICGVSIHEGKTTVKTIMEKEPVGICGTGAIEALYELYQQEIMDETGLLDDEYVEDGYELCKGKDNQSICFYQKDIRELQLAKSAVRAGMETLMKRYPVTEEEIEHVYIAGGFGYHMDIKKAAGIGLIPPSLIPKVKLIGNGSLAGAVYCGCHAEGLNKAEEVVKLCKEIPLSTDKDFNELYMEHMYFAEEEE